MNKPYKNIKDKLRHGCSPSITLKARQPSVVGVISFMEVQKHRLSSHPLYSVWHGMKCRCYTPSSNGYKNYGGRGVKMCEEWRVNFKAFYDWAIENGWQKRMHIDKDIKAKELNVEANLYSPERCLVITPKRNCNLRRTNRILEYNGKSLTISQWADHIGIPRNAIRMRIEVHGWSIEDALTLPLYKKNKNKING